MRGIAGGAGAAIAIGAVAAGVAWACSKGVIVGGAAFASSGCVGARFAAFSACVIGVCPAALGAYCVVGAVGVAAIVVARHVEVALGAVEVFVGNLDASAVRVVVVVIAVAAAAAVAILVFGGVHHESFVGSDSSVVFLAHGSSLCVAIEAEGG